MARYVLDASVVAALFVDDPLTGEAAALLERLHAEDASFHAPEFLLHELVSVLVKAVRRGALSAEGSLQALDATLRAEIELHGATDLAAPSASLALAHDLSAYDAAYLALAIGIGATLVTGDRSFSTRAAASGAAVRLVESAA